MRDDGLAPEVRAAYAHCARVVRRSQSSFAAAFWLFPKPRRRALHAIYAFCRLADDIADDPGVVTYLNHPTVALKRTYQDPSGQRLTLVIIGNEGEDSFLLFSHTPEICYSSRAQTIIDQRQRVRLPIWKDSVEEFWALTFQANDLDKAVSRTYYAWSTGGKWSATQRPRLTYAGYPYLYKLQLASTLLPNADLTRRDPCLEFLKDFVPAAKPYLVDCAGN